VAFPQPADKEGPIAVGGVIKEWHVQPTDIRRLLQMLGAMNQANIVASKDVTGTVTADLYNVTLEEALDSILAPNGYAYLRKGKIVALLVDRHMGRDRVKVTFLGRPAWFLRTPIVMASLTGAPLVPCSIRRIGRGRFAALPGDPVEVRSVLPRDAAIQTAAQEIASQLEAEVRAHPECWYQFYRYWDAQRDEYVGLD
jgi:predicted LPLAT superfamily acyltransferase